MEENTAHFAGIQFISHEPRTNLRPRSRSPRRQHQRSTSLVLPFRQFRYSGWGGDEASGGQVAPSVDGPLALEMLTRKQQWRRTRTRKHVWADLPPEVVEAMMAAGGSRCAGMAKSVSWDHSYAAGLRIRADNATRRHDDSRATHQKRSRHGSTAASAAGSRANGTGAAEPVQIPRSVSCSSLSAKRTLFPRTSSRDELAGTAAQARRGSVVRRRIMPRRRGVTFDTQVGVLAP